MEKFDYTKTPGKVRKRFYTPDVSTALVSVITPFYNAGKYFEETFNSVMNQTFPWFEWIIVDDGSTEKVDIELLDNYAKKDSRIRVIHQENGGLSCARNTGFKNSKTDFVVPLDADDLISPQFLECLFWALKNNPDAAWAYCDSYGFGEQEYIWQYPFDAERMKKENMLVATAMIRKKDYEDIGGYKIEKWSYNEDWRFWLEMLEKHKKPVHIDTELFWYRRLNKGMLSSIVQNSERVEFNERIIKEAASKVDGKVQGIEYPRSKSQYSFFKPKFSRWTRLSNPKKQRRILWIIPWMVMGGADKFNLDAISGLSKKGYENCILTTLTSGNEWKQRFEEYTDEIFCMPDFMDPAQYIEFVSYYIQSRQIDILIVTNSYDGYYMLPWIRQHFPELVIIDYVHMEEWYWRAGGHARSAGALNGITEKTFVCNSSTKRVLLENFGCKSDSVECLYIGVDHLYYDPKNEKKGYLHRLLKLPEERPIILFPCRIHEQKRPFMLLDIANVVAQSIPKVAFVVVGDGPQLEELKQSIKNRGLDKTIFCIGRSEKMRACYRDSELTLICSLKEGLALTAYESCSMGVPVISSDVGGQKDLIGNDVGVLIPLQQDEEKDLNKREFSKAEIDAYAVQIQKLLLDDGLREELGKAGRRKIERGFSVEKMVQHLDSELQNLCEEPQRKIERHNIAEFLNSVPNLAADFYTMYSEWKRKDEECEEVWRTRTWLQSKLDQAYSKQDGILLRTYKLLIGLPLIGHTMEKVIHIVWGTLTRSRT